MAGADYRGTASTDWAGWDVGLAARRPLAVRAPVCVKVWCSVRRAVKVLAWSDVKMEVRVSAMA